MLTIRFTDDALKDLRRIGAVGAAKIKAKLDAYADKPSAFVNQVKVLRGVDALRLRVGDYRVIFTQDGIVLHVLHIGHRRDVYR